MIYYLCLFYVGDNEASRVVFKQLLALCS